MLRLRLLWQIMRDRFTRLRSEKGNITLAFALSTTSLLLVGAGAMQIAAISNSKEKYQSAADSAVLAAIAPNVANEDIVEVAKKAFKVNLNDQERAAITSLNVTFETGRVRSATLSYSANQESLLSDFTGMIPAKVSGTASARKADFRYVDIDLWLDGSASMGVAADETERAKLRWLSRNDGIGANCNFACHLPADYVDASVYPTSEKRAHAHGVKLRHDIMKESVQTLIDEMDDAFPRGLRPRYAVARLVYNWERQLDYTSDIAKARNFVGTFQLSPEHPYSRLSLAINQGAKALAVGSGDGSAINPEKIVVLVTDGMQFDYFNIPLGPVSASACDEVKARGYRLAVVQLRYLKDPGEYAFDYWVAAVYDQLTPALKTCASPGYYFTADKPDEVRAAFRQLAKTLEESLRLTQ